MKRFRILRPKTILLFALFLLTAVLWQNCGEINLLPNTKQDPTGTIQSPESSPTTFRLPPTRDYIMRVAFLVDVSASMQTKGCLGDGADFDVSQDCDRGDKGADPFFHRLRMIETWIRQTDDFLAAKGLPANRLEMVFIPFSMSGHNDPAEPNGYERYDNTIDLFLNHKTFTSDRQAIFRILDTYRKMYYAKLEHPPADQYLDPSWNLSPYMPNFDKWKEAGAKYIKTSIPAPSIDRMLTSIKNELLQIQGENEDLLSQTRFEVVFLSDGVGKPHHEDVRRSFELYWDARRIFRDYKRVYEYLRETEGMCGANNQHYVDNHCEFEEIDFSREGSNCSDRCREDIDHLIATGERRADPTKFCRKCIDSILDYRSTAAASNGGPAGVESFLEAVRNQWGDHQLNHNLNIQRSIKDIEYLFRQYSQVEYRFSFIRFDSQWPELQTPPELLSVERNWLVQSAIKWRGQHRHAVATTSQIPFALFPGQAAINGYKLSQFFVINPHARLNSIGIVTLDSDADGLFDHEEEQLGAGYDKQKTRSDGACLDSIVYRFGPCVSLNCDPEIDLDGDGLNQCEEQTLGTSDTDFDTDGDGISDYLEMVYGLNPLIDDTKQDYNGDGVSNFVNFTLGATPWAYVQEVDAAKKINLTVREADPVPITIDGQSAHVPSYAFQLLNLPTLGSLSALGAGPTYFNIAKREEHKNLPPVIAESFETNYNKVLLFGRVDHAQSIGDMFWIYQALDIPFTTEPLQIQIDLQNMQVMPWKDTEGALPYE